MVRLHSWPPFVVNDMYVDEVDHEGLYFWVDDVKRCNHELKEKGKYNELAGLTEEQLSAWYMK